MVLSSGENDVATIFLTGGVGLFFVLMLLRIRGKP